MPNLSAESWRDPGAYLYKAEQSTEVPIVPVDAPAGTEKRAVQKVLAETIELIARIEEYCHSPRSAPSANGGTIVALKTSPTLLDSANREAHLIRTLWKQFSFKLQGNWQDWVSIAHYDPSSQIDSGTGLDGERWQHSSSLFEENYFESLHMERRHSAFLLSGFSKTGYRNIETVGRMACILSSYLSDEISNSENAMDFIANWIIIVRPQTKALFADPPRWFTNPEAAEFLGVSKSTVKNWKRAGKLHVNGDGKISEASLTPLMLQLK